MVHVGARSGILIDENVDFVENLFGVVLVWVWIVSVVGGDLMGMGHDLGVVHRFGCGLVQKLLNLKYEVEVGDWKLRGPCGKEE